MSAWRGSISSILAITIMASPGWAGSGSGLGTIVNAEHAHVGNGLLSAGATVFGGDRLYTEDSGSVQLRAGAARFLLSNASIAVMSKDEATPGASLTRGTAIFSTANSKAFVLHVGDMVIRPETDQPTVAQVSISGPRELTVRSTRGSVSVAVDDDVRVIPEGMAYRIVLDPTEAELSGSEASDASQSPEGVGGGGGRRRGPLKAGRNRFIWYAIGIAAIVTGVALYEALESPSSPH
jgi:hypothetical protein